MESLKNKLGILVLILCLGIVIAVVWYCLFGISGNDDALEGTLVQGIHMEDEMMLL